MLGGFAFPERRYYKSWRLWENHLRKRIKKEGLPADPHFARAMLLQANLHRFLYQHRFHTLDQVAKKLGISYQRANQLYKGHGITRLSHATNAPAHMRIKRDTSGEKIAGDYAALCQLVHSWQTLHDKQPDDSPWRWVLRRCADELAAILANPDPREEIEVNTELPRYNEAGERLCSFCKDYRPVSEFGKSKLAGGLNYKCKRCNKYVPKRQRTATNTKEPECL